jgi:hypothetical protein
MHVKWLWILAHRAVAKLKIDFAFCLAIDQTIRSFIFEPDEDADVERAAHVEMEAS